jgi:hypothetical protein
VTTSGPPGSGPDDVDDELERELHDAAGLLDPVPDRLVRAAAGLFSWRTIDADLAALVFDSADAQAAAAVRGPGQPRLLTFTAGSMSIELEIDGSGPDRAITGQLVPAQPAEIEARLGELRRTTTADDLGRFRLAATGSGPVSLRVRAAGPGSPVVVTEWFSG